MSDSEMDALRMPNGRSDMSRIEALERNLMSLERFVHALQKDINDIKKALRENALDELVAQAQELDMGYGGEMLNTDVVKRGVDK